MKRSYISYAVYGAVLVSLSTPAFAYLDGATGSMLIQALIGGVATAGMFGRHFLAKIKTAFSAVTRKDIARRED